MATKPMKESEKAEPIAERKREAAMTPKEQKRYEKMDDAQKYQPKKTPVSY